MTNTTNFTVPLDTDIGIERNRTGRWTVFGIFTALTPIITTTFTAWLGGQFFPANELINSICSVVGFAAAIPLVLISAEKFFFIRNDTTAMFVTQDTFATLRNSPDVNILYGPGTHVSYPWERRIGANNISLSEAPNTLEFTVQCRDGTLTGKGSFRLRPDQRNPVAFLSSVAGVADDISDLIKTEILAWFKAKSAVEAMDSLEDLNIHLKTNFADVDTEVEKRCGVKLSDISISELLPSEELRRTFSALSEATVVQEGVRIILGLTQNQIDRRIKAGTMTQADVNLARDRFLSISGNLDGMQIKRSEFDLSVHGIDGEAIKALVELAKTPAAQAAAVAAAGSSRGRAKSKK